MLQEKTVMSGVAAITSQLPEPGDSSRSERVGSPWGSGR